MLISCGNSEKQKEDKTPFSKGELELAYISGGTDSMTVYLEWRDNKISTEEVRPRLQELAKERGFDIDFIGEEKE